MFGFVAVDAFDIAVVDDDDDDDGADDDEDISDVAIVAFGLNLLLLRVILL